MVAKIDLLGFVVVVVIIDLKLQCLLVGSCRGGATGGSGGGGV